MFGSNKIQELETENQRLASDLANLSAWAEKYKIMDAVQIQTANTLTRRAPMSMLGGLE